MQSWPTALQKKLETVLGEDCVGVRVESGGKWAPGSLGGGYRKRIIESCRAEETVTRLTSPVSVGTQKMVPGA